MKRVLILFLCVLCACSPTKRAPQSLRLAFNAPPQTFDPRKSADFLSSTLVCLMYEGLTRCAPGGGVEPALAEKWTISPDGKTYVFTLRHALWSDGKEVSAMDFERSWKKILDPSFSSPAAYLLFPIKNGEKFAKREVEEKDVGIYALDAKTLKVELERPTPYFLPLTAFPLFLPAPDDVEKVQNGPFCLAKWDPNDQIILVKNPKFWNAKKIQLDQIHIHVIPDEMTALKMFERGEIDWLGSPLSPIPPDALPSLRERLQFLPMPATTFLAFNTQTFPFHNPSLRKAFALSVDRERIVSEITSIGQLIPQRLVPPSLYPTSFPPFSFEDPIQILFQTGLEELQITKEALASLTLYYRPTQMEKRLAQALQQEWKKALGVTIQIEQLDQKTHLDRLHRHDFQISLASWIAQFPDPVNILERFRLATNQKNYAGWENDIYKNLLEQSALEIDPTHRFALLAEAEEILAQEFPIFPLYHWAAPSMASPRVQGIATSPCGGVLFERFRYIEDRDM